jgi:hypothetical protein
MTIEQKAEEYTNKNGMPQIKQKCIYEAITKAYIKGHQDASIEIENYATFCVACDREGLPLINYNDYLLELKKMNTLPSTESINLK